MLNTLDIFPSNIQLFLLTPSRDLRQNQIDFKKNGPRTSRKQTPLPTHHSTWPTSLTPCIGKCLSLLSRWIVCRGVSLSLDWLPLPSGSLLLVCNQAQVQSRSQGLCFFFPLNFPALKLKRVKKTHGRMQAPELVPNGSLLHGDSSADLQTSGEKGPENPQTAGQPARAEGRCCTSQFLPSSWGPHYEGGMEPDGHILS